MKTLLNISICLCACLWMTNSATQDKDAFHAGKVIPEFGTIADVDSDMELNTDTKLKLCFDVARKSGDKAVNQSFDSAARFINLNVASGAVKENVEVAIVLHGSAAIDATNGIFYSGNNAAVEENPNAGIIAELQKNNTTFYVCGQTAAYRGIKKKDLLPGVKMAPSAMTAHAVLQQEGFSLSPF